MVERRDDAAPATEVNGEQLALPGTEEQAVAQKEPAKETVVDTKAVEPNVEAPQKSQEGEQDWKQEIQNTRKGMHKALQQSSLLAKQVEELKTLLVQQGQHPQTSNLPQAQIEEEFEQKFGLTTKQAQGMAQIYRYENKGLMDKVDQLGEMVVENQLSVAKSKLKSDDFALSIPEVEESFDAYLKARPYNERVKPSVIEDCRNRAKADNFEVIVAKRIESELAKLQKSNAKPATPPSTAKPTPGAAEKPKVNYKITDSQKESLRNLGLNPDDPDVLSNFAEGGNQ